MNKFGLFAAGLVAAAGFTFAAPSAQAIVFADSVVEFVPGTGTRGPDGNSAPDDGSASLGAPDGLFTALGVGGYIVLDFGTTFPAKNNATVFEVTFNCDDSGGLGCDGWPEAVDIYTGSGWVAGTSTPADFAFQTTIYNNQAQGGAIVAAVGGGFSQMLLVDVPLDPKTSTRNAGFDLESVGVTPIPVPAALPLLAGALGLAGWLGRRRKAA